MAKLNTTNTVRTTPRPAASPLQTRTGQPDTITSEGAPAHTHTDKTALFLLGAGRFYGEDSFYEKANDGTQRYVQLVRAVAAADPLWLSNFVFWLRNDANIRTASIVAAAEGAQAFTKAGEPILAYTIVLSALVRADEPGEFVAYWRNNLRRSMPRPVLRALRQAIGRLYTERNVIKYDSNANANRFADVIELVHPTPVDETQTLLFKYLLDQRHHGDGSTAGLLMLDSYRTTQKALTEDRPNMLRMLTHSDEMAANAGITWENLSSSGPMDAAAWEAIISNMGYMALLRNLRNFDEAGVNAGTKQEVADRLSSQTAVLNSRQLPYRFLSAYLNAQGAVWQPALESALQHSLANIPALPGKTVVLVDTSGSMGGTLSNNSKVSYAMAGALFGVALAAAQGNAALGGFADGVKPYWFPVTSGAAVLRSTEAFVRTLGRDGYGTNIHAATQWAYQAHPDAARIVIVTDGQCRMGNVSGSIPASVPIYAFNLAGYGQTAIESGSTRHQLGGLGDQTFGLIKMVEAGQQGTWPWE